MKVELSLDGLTTMHDYDMCIMEHDSYGSLIFYDIDTVKQIITGLQMLLESDE